MAPLRSTAFLFMLLLLLFCPGPHKVFEPFHSLLSCKEWMEVGGRPMHMSGCLYCGGNVHYTSELFVN